MTVNTIFSINNFKIKNTLIAATLVSLVGCGSGGGSSNGSGGSTHQSLFSGNETAATATTENSEDIARAASEGLTRALETEGMALPIGADIEEENIFSIFNELVNEQDLSLPTAFTQVYQGDCGGTERFTGPDSEPSIGSRFTVRIEYNNYCESGGMITDGMYEYTATYMGGDSLVDANFVYDVDYIFDSQIVSSINVVAQCQGELDRFDAENCTITSDFVGVTGGTYRISNVDINGNSLTATVYESVLGRIEISASNLHQCSNGNFDSGTILITDSTGSAVISVTFSSCDEYVVTYQGVANTYSQLNN